MTSWCGGSRLAGVAAVEEAVFRLCLLQVLRYFLRTPESVATGAQKHRFWTPWSVITSVLFAITHMNPVIMGYAVQLSQSFEGQLYIARNIKHMTEAFFGGIFFFNPLMERHGIFAAIGAHVAWNATVYALPIQYSLLVAHLIHRLLGGYTLAWRTTPLQKAADISMHWYFWLGVVPRIHTHIISM